ncbi:MAG: hypothetical protein ACXVBW_13955, partial [Bdellovibrionota bacterium]
EFVSPTSLSTDVLRLELGRKTRIGSPYRFPGGSFAAQQDGSFQGSFTPGASPVPLALSGRWFQDDERIWTTEPDAYVLVRVPSSRLSVVAASVTKSADVPRMAVEIGQVPAYDSVAGEDVTMLDSGQSVALVKTPRLYHLLNKLPEKERLVTLRFPLAASEPIALYGLRFGN